MVQMIRDTRDFIEECWAELQKVTWPDYEQLQNATLVVIVFTFLVSGTIWIMDVTVRFLVDVIMGMFGA
ncbi:MAG: preprotein translocase subunit SecE [Longimicrobiales bacterium]